MRLPPVAAGLTLPAPTMAPTAAMAFVPVGPTRLLGAGAGLGQRLRSQTVAVRRRRPGGSRHVAGVDRWVPEAMSADPSPRRGDKAARPGAPPTSPPSASTGNGQVRAANTGTDADDRPGAAPPEAAATPLAAAAAANVGDASADGSSAAAAVPGSDKPATNGGVEISIGFRKIQVPGKALLFGVAALWGSFSPFVRLLFTQEHAPPPALFNTERLLVSSAVYLPVLWGEFAMYRADQAKALEELAVATEAAPTARDEPTEAETATVIDDVKEPRLAFLWAGLELGGFVFLANVSQVLGLEQTSASRAAFLNQLQTVVVPILAGALGLQAISNRTWVSSAIAVAGVGLLSLDKSHGAVSSLTGDGLEVLSAFFFSAYILRLGKYASTVRAPPLVATKIMVQAILSICWVTASTALSASHAVGADYAPGGRIVPIGGVLGTGWSTADVAINFGVVIWTGLFVSALSGYIQTKGQSAVKPSDAAVIFATQPLFAAALSALILGEGFGPKGITGGLLILGATIVSSLEGGPKPDADAATVAAGVGEGGDDGAAAADKKSR